MRPSQPTYSDFQHNQFTSQDAQSQLLQREQGRIQHHTPFGGPRPQFKGGAVTAQRFDWKPHGTPQGMSTTTGSRPTMSTTNGSRPTMSTTTGGNPFQSERPMWGVGEGNMPVLGAQGNIRITQDPLGETPYRYLTTDNVSYPDLQSAQARQALIERGMPQYMIEEQCPPPSIAAKRRQ